MEEFLKQFKNEKREENNQDLNLKWNLFQNQLKLREEGDGYCYRMKEELKWIEENEQKLNLKIVESFFEEMKREERSKWNSFWNGEEKPKNVESIIKSFPLEKIKRREEEIQRIWNESLSFRRIWGENGEKRMKSCLQSTTFSSPNVENLVFHLVSHEFSQFAREKEGREEEEEEEIEREDSIQFSHFLDRINSLDLFEGIFSEFLFNQIQSKIESICRGNYEEELFSSVLEWLDGIVLQWLRQSISNQKLFDQWKTRITFFCYQTFVDLRISEMFDIITGYPDSIPALKDLQGCISKTNQQQQLIESLRTALCSRLLHPGANTSVIITTYIDTIRSLQLLDDSGVMLDQIAEPVREYLKNRSDTMHSIVTSCTEDEESDLYKELMNTDDDSVYIAPTNKQLKEEINGDDNEQGDNWSPAFTSSNGYQNTEQDVITILINIYGSPDPFIAEYRQCLSERLLNLNNFETDNEIKIIELLKLRFGESNFYSCEIMIRDIASSKRIRNNDPLEIQNSLHTTIVSYLFWPSFRDEKFEPPSIIQSKMKRYTSAYKKLNPSRDLEWKMGVGTVDIELSFEDGRVVSFSVSPILASIISMFNTQGTWKLNELSSQLKMNPDLLKKKISFWVNNKTIKEIEPNTFAVIEFAEEGEEVNDVEEEVETVSASQSQKEEALLMVENFVRGMLKVAPQGQLPAEKIHSSLCSLLPDYDLNATQLHNFLIKMTREEKLLSSGNQFSLKK
eukprot:TRINITY_DN1971_c1_g1_i3.p1 TRINITY_DN1971_c1_g1~~TRINITY_DN1971_c1_g1_i3.p1  ORF type:complete len:737 (-),score=246.00 TRINITY_DN1971_c1_g1_i3:21-2231(-)